MDGDKHWIFSSERGKVVEVKERLNPETMYRPYQLFELLAKYRHRNTWKLAGDANFHGQNTIAVDVKCKE